MRCPDAPEKLDPMTPGQLQAVALEIALLGRQGSDARDPTTRHNPGSMPEDFTGLQLVYMPYEGFKRINPGHDMHFDHSDEHALAEKPFAKGEA